MSQYGTQEELQALLDNSKKPAALALADGLEETMQWPLHGRAADELRKQHELLRQAYEAVPGTANAKMDFMVALRKYFGEEVTPKVRIGSAYQPERRELRGNNGELQSYRGWLDRDMARLQDALLNEERVPLSEWAWSVVGLVLFVGLLAAIAFIGPELL